MQPPTPARLDTLDLSGLPEDARVAFYGALFAMSAADRVMVEAETDLIDESLHLEGLSSDARRKVLGYSITPPALEQCLLHFQDADAALRHGLMLNLIDVVLADHAIEPGEHEGLHHARQMLDVSFEEMEAMHEAAYAIRLGENGASSVRRPIRLVLDGAPNAAT